MCHHLHISIFIHHLISFVNLMAVVCNVARIMANLSPPFLSLFLCTIPIICVGMCNVYVYMCMCGVSRLMSGALLVCSPSYGDGVSLIFKTS